MSHAVLVPLDMNKNEVQNLRIQNLATAPSAPVEGQLYQNTTDHKMYRYNGTAWYELGAGGGGDLFGPAGATDGNLAAFDGATGKTLKDTTVTATGAADAISKKHTQHTDTGTTSEAFQVDSGNSGPKLKNNAGVLEARNAGDSDYANVKCKALTITGNLTVQGTQTTVESETLEIEDNVVLLNSNVTGSPTEDGGVEVERGTSTNAQMVWDETNDVWAAGLAGALLPVARKYAAAVGDGNATSIAVTHGLATRDVQVQLYQAASPYAQVLCDVEHTDANTVTLKFAAAPTSGQYRVVITG